MRVEDRDQIVKQFELSLEDAVLSRSERKSLKKMIQGYRPIKHDLDWVRSEIFDLARTACDKYDAKLAMNWAEEAVKVLASAELEDKTGNSRVYFSPGTECLDAITHQLKQAKNKVDICVFTISNNEIRDAISDAYKRNVQIRILTDNDKSFDKGSDIYFLKEKGLKVRFDGTRNHMHHKFALVDNKTVLTGSFNWTRSAVEYNQENILITTEPNAVREYSNEFDRLWMKFE